MNISRDFLYQKYIVEKLNLREIADIIGCSNTTVMRRMESYNIPRRSKSEISRARWESGICDGNAKQISWQHKSGQRNTTYKNISKGLKKHFSDPENRSRISGERSHLWKGGRVERVCEICGRPFKVYPYLIKKGNGRFCGARCQSLWQSRALSGENSPCWRGGNKPYPPIFNKQFKEAIRARDNFTCIVCGKKEEECAHDIHHINYIKKDTFSKNCVTLCKSCHMRTNFNRNFWQNYFSSYFS